MGIKHRVQAPGFLLVGILSFASSLFATEPPATLREPVCTSWSKPASIGTLDASMLSEASGLEVWGGQFYHINDSGDGPYFYISARDGSKTRKIEIKDFKPRDVEEIAIGPCGQSQPCLFIGDIGDNKEKRTNIEIVVLSTDIGDKKQVEPLRIVQLQYPDRPHNAEAMAITPKGDLIIFTKEMEKKKDGEKGKKKEKVAQPSQVFRLEAAKLAAGGKQIHALQHYGQLDVPTLVGAAGYEGLVTGMDISSSGDRTLLLTYDKAIEFSWNFNEGPLPSSPSLQVGKDLRLIPIQRLNQQEAVSYDENQRDFIYDTETEKTLGLFGGKADLMAVRCQDSRGP